MYWRRGLTYVILIHCPGSALRICCVSMTVWDSCSQGGCVRHLHPTAGVGHVSFLFFSARARYGNAERAMGLDGEHWGCNVGGRWYLWVLQRWVGDK